MDTYTVMFVDIVNSTSLKHLHDPHDAYDLIKWLFDRIQRIAPSGAKFTGDGGMMVFPDERISSEILNGSQHALLAAERVIQEVDGLNLAFKKIADLGERRPPTAKNPRTGSDIRLQVRIGITTATPTKIFSNNPLDVVGTVTDLAARLSSEADLDGILVYKTTMERAIEADSSLSGRFFPCDRRLQLKGVPRDIDGFYHFSPDRLVGTPADGPYIGGILAMFTHRAALANSFPPGRIINMATEGSELLVAGRTLKFWATRVLAQEEYLSMARRKKLKLHFLISSKDSCRYLDDAQVKAIERDQPEAITIFKEIQSRTSSDGDFEFKLRETDHLFLDGLVYADIELPGNPIVKERTRIVLQDINATDHDVQISPIHMRDDPKATLLFACICNQDADRRKYCKVCGLHDRTWNIFENHARDIQ